MMKLIFLSVIVLAITSCNIEGVSDDDKERSNSKETLKPNDSSTMSLPDTSNNRSKVVENFLKKVI